MSSHMRRPPVRLHRTTQILIETNLISGNVYESIKFHIYALKTQFNHFYTHYMENRRTNSTDAGDVYSL